MWEISSFYTCVPKITIIWCTAPEIQSETHNFCHFGPLYIFCTFFVLSTEFFFYHFGPLFVCHLFAVLLHNNLKDQNFKNKWKKEKKNWRYYHFINVYPTWQSCDVCFKIQNFLSFWTIFCPFSPIATQKIKILKK